jgi:hypothetical protein
MQVIANNFTHFEFNYNDICNAKKRDSVNSFERPAFFHFRTRAANTTDDYKANLLIFTSPIEEGRCRVHIPELKIKFAPRWMFHLGANRLFNSDTWLHDAERSVRTTNSINQQRGSIAVGAAGAGRNLTNGLTTYLHQSLIWDPLRSESGGQHMAMLRLRRTPSVQHRHHLYPGIH